MEKKTKSNWGIIFITCLIIMLLGVGIFYLCEYLDLNADNLKNRKKEKETKEEVSGYTALDGMESLSIGKERYDKATEIYSVWKLRPYCGYSVDELDKVNKISFSDSASGNGNYYESDFSGIDELKEYLSKWLSAEIINDNVIGNVVTDLELLKDNKYAYTDYINKDNKLYCRLDTGKGWLSNYLNKYTITVDTITDESITYNITSEYAKGDASSECLENLNISSCSSEEIEKKDTKFTISKNKSNKWVVTSFVLHD